MNKHSILGYAQNFAKYGPLLVVDRSSSLVGEVYAFRTPDEKQLRILVTPEGKVLTSVEGQQACDPIDLTSVLPPSGAYLIQWSFNTLLQPKDVAEELQKGFDHSIAGMFHVYQGKEDSVHIVLERQLSEDAEFLRNRIILGQTAEQAAVNQVVEEMRDHFAPDSLGFQMLQFLIKSPTSVVDWDGVLAEFQQYVWSSLTPFRVSYRESVDGDLLPGFFDCMAVDNDHAEEQCENAYPGCEVINVIQFDHTNTNRVIFCELEDVDGDGSCGFWSNIDGWVDLDSATRFTEWQSQSTNLPMSKGHVQWVLLDEAQAYVRARSVVRSALEHQFKLIHGADGAMAFAIEAKDTEVVDPSRSDCARFTIDPSEAWGISPALSNELKGLNKTLARATEDAINAGCLAIQEALQVNDGGFAGLFFSNDDQVHPIRAVLARYMAAQIGHIGDGTVPVPHEDESRLGRWNLCYDQDEPRRLEIDFQGKPGYIHIKAEDEGFVVDLFTDDAIPVVAAGTCATYSELFPINDDVVDSNKPVEG